MEYWNNGIMEKQKREGSILNKEEENISALLIQAG